MSANLSADMMTKTKPKAILRIAVPSFNFSFAKGKVLEKFKDTPSKEEFQDAFHGELTRPVDSISLTESERTDYNITLDLRNALYTD
jgi:hypothetical protein